MTDGAVWESTNKGENLKQLLLSVRLASNTFRLAVYGHRKNPDLILLAAAGGLYRRTTLREAPTMIYSSSHPLVSVTVDPRDAKLIWVMGAHQVSSSVDAGATFASIAVPATLAAQTFQAIVAVGSPADRLFLSTDRGVFLCALSTDAWAQVVSPQQPSQPGNMLPNIIVADMEYNAVKDVLAIATLGRGAWTLSSASKISLPAATKR
jgi:hypothetical protein